MKNFFIYTLLVLIGYSLGVIAVFSYQKYKGQDFGMCKQKLNELVFLVNEQQKYCETKCKLPPEK